MKRKLLSLLVTFSLVLSLLPIGAMAQTSGFSDMPAEGYWSYAALSAAVENGLLEGSNGMLKPEQSLTRAQLAAILVRAFGAQDKAGISAYADVGASDWFYDDIARAVHMGALQGNNGAMRPNDPVTRQEAFLILARAFKLADADPEDLAEFSDYEQTADWAAPALAAMVGEGYVQGSGGKLNPVSTISRAEFAQVMYNLVSVYLSAEGSYTDSVEGNVVINASGVTLRDMTITGDLIIGDGVGNGDVTLDGVTVEGRVVVRAGGENSIHIINSSDVGSIVISKKGDGGVRIRAEEGCRIQVVYVDDGNDDVILEGTYNAVTVESDTPLTLKDAEVTTLSVKAQNAAVTLKGSSTVTVANISSSAGGAKLTVEKGTKIALVESAASAVTIQGEGTVTQAKISGNDTAVNTQGTDISVSEGTTGVTDNGEPVTPETPAGGGSTGGGTSSVRNVSGEDAFLAALSSGSVTTVVVTGDITLDTDAEINKPVTINAGAALRIGAAEVSLYSTITNNGTLATVLVPEAGVEGWLNLRSDLENPEVAGRIINNGTFSNRGGTEVTPLTGVDNSGTLINYGVITYIDVYGMDGQDPAYEAVYEAERITDVTDDGGKINNVAVVLSLDGIYAALSKNVSGGTDALYDFISVTGDNSPSYTAAANIGIRQGQRFYVERDTTLTIPSEVSLTIAEGAELYVYGTLTIEGAATNNGMYIRELGGVIDGSSSDVTDGSITTGSGTHYNAYYAANDGEWAAALADEHCCYIEITGDVTVAEDTEVDFGLSVIEGATLTVAADKRLALRTVTDFVMPDPYTAVAGTLVNNGTIVIETDNGIFVTPSGTLDNDNGIIDVYGFLEADHDALGGTLNFYANRRDVAATLWNRLGGILPLDVDEAADYDNADYADVLSYVGEDDDEGRYALVWLMKNGVLPTEDIDPYGYVDGDTIEALLDAFAEEAGQPDYVPPEINGGVCVSNGVDETGNDLDQLISSFVSDLGVSSVNVASEAALADALDKNYVQEIHITANIELTGNLDVTKRVFIDFGAILTAAADRNITVAWREDSEPGVLAVNGELIIPTGSNLINQTEVNMTGTITNNGTITNMTDTEGRYNSNFFGEGGTIANNGTFVTNSYMQLTGTALINSGTGPVVGATNHFTNNGNLILYGGAVTSTSDFHNAGYMKIIDTFNDNLETDSENEITVLDFDDPSTLTNNSNWIDYTAAVYSADGFTEAQEEQNAMLAALGDDQPTTGLESYNRLDIMADMEITSDVTITGWDVWVVTDRQWNNETQQDDLTPHTLTIGSGGAVTVTGDRSLNVEGNLINGGTITLGTQERGGSLFVWPTGKLTNNGTVDDTNGLVYRMDEYKDDGSAGLKDAGEIHGTPGYTGARDLAIVHDWAALQDAATGGVYENINVMGDDCDITLESDLEISADMYIEWDDGIEVPEEYALSLTGGHWLNNSGDIWVFGTMTVGADYGINNDSDIYIQEDGVLTNNGMIRNYNHITLMLDSLIQGSGTLVNCSEDGITDNGGAITCVYYQLVKDLDGLTGAMGSGTPALIAGEVVLEGDLELTADVMVGMKDNWEGHLCTGSHTLTVPSGITLAMDNGELEIGDKTNGGGAVVNHGIMTFSATSGLRMLTDEATGSNGSTLSTDSDINIYGWLELYDWENQHSYITGTSTLNNYADECGLVQFIYSQMLYTTGENGVPTAVQTAVDGLVVAYDGDTGFDTEEKIAVIGSGISGWKDIAGNPENPEDNGDIFAQYAYAALHQNGLVGDSIDPHHKLTYAEAKALMTEVAELLNVDEVTGVADFLSGIPNSDDLICNNDFDYVYDTDSGEYIMDPPSTFDQRCNEFKDAVVAALGA